MEVIVTGLLLVIEGLQFHGMRVQFRLDGAHQLPVEEAWALPFLLYRNGWFPMFREDGFAITMQ